MEHWGRFWGNGVLLGNLLDQPTQSATSTAPPIPTLSDLDNSATTTPQDHDNDLGKLEVSTTGPVPIGGQVQLDGIEALEQPALQRLTRV
ncbi:hypothetical protein C0989_006510, partial [Termitomyces sp. Mn162]